MCVCEGGCSDGKKDGHGFMQNSHDTECDTGSEAASSESLWDETISLRGSVMGVLSSLISSAII